MTEYIHSIKELNWEEKFAKLISYVFHPLLVPTLSSFLIFNLGGYIVFSVPSSLKYVVYAIVFINTFIIPSLASYILFKKGIIHSLHMHTIQERRFPLLITLLFFFLTYYFLQKIPLPPILFLILLGATLSIMAATIINLFYKISAHMIGAGGLVGAMIGMSIRLSLDLNNIVIGLIFLSGIVGYARLKLDAHDHGQIYLGFMVGLSSMLFVILGI